MHLNLSLKGFSLTSVHEIQRHRSKVVVYSTPSSHSNAAEPMIFNPISMQYIKQTPPSIKESTWFQLMHQQGGFIAHSGVLAPIDLEALLRWEDAQKTPLDEDPSDQSHYDISPYSKYLQDDTWGIISANPTYSNGTSMMHAEKYPCIDQLLFLNKPTKMLTLPGIAITDNLASQVNSWLYSSKEGEKLMTTAIKSSQNKAMLGKRSMMKDGGIDRYRVRPCHRLDYDTSGVIAIGLTAESHRKTSLLFENRNVNKTYVALVAGHVEQDYGVISFPVGKVPSKAGDFHEFACYTDRNGIAISDFIEGSLREAETEYFVSNRFTIPMMMSHASAKYTRIILKPNTGRGHQLRLHLSAIGHPILGDALHSHSRDISRCASRLCLHAEELQMAASTKNNKAIILRIESLAPF